METYQIDGLAVKPIGPESFGAEVSGINWEQIPLPETTIKTLAALQDKYGFIVFRNTGMTNESHVEFAGQFGEREVNPAWGGTQRVGSQYLFDVSNLEADGSLVKRGTRRWAHALGNALWHTDSSFNQHRVKYSMLLSHRIPGPGEANTEFADTRRAWKDLPEEKKAELRDLISEHELWHSRRLASPDIYGNPTEEELTTRPPAFHRLVQKAPNGEGTLYIAAHLKTLFTQHGKALENSQEIVWELIRHCTQPKYTVSCEWLAAGDMMWWDNRQSMHRATPYDESMGPRDVRRVTIKDDSESAFGVPKPTSVIDDAALRGTEIVT